jgi:signal transduction histidine kinase
MLEPVFYAACMKALVACGVLLISAALLSAQTAGDARGSQPVLLTNLQQVLALGNEPSALTNVTGRIRGRVTFALYNRTSLFFQEGTNGIFVIYHGPITNVAPGTWVEVEGPLAAGALAPHFNGARLTVLDPGSLPAPWPAHSEAMVGGGHHARFVSVRGYVRDMQTSWGNFTLLLGDEAGTFQVQIRVGNNFHLPREWIDAEVEARGVCWAATDSRGRPYGFTIYSASTNFLRLLRPGREDPFDLPPQRLNDLLPPGSNVAARARTQGTVTHYSTMGQFYMEDENSVAQVLAFHPLNQADQEGEGIARGRPVTLRPGDRVEVVGTPRRNGSILSLSHAEYRKIGQAALALPITVKVEDLMTGQFPARLVRLKARVLDREVMRSGPLHIERIICQAGDQIFTALMDNLEGVELPLHKNGYAEVTGLCIPQAGRWKTVHSFNLLLRDVNDLRPVPAPTWWERPDVLRTAAISGGVLVLAAAWVFWQRRHIQRLRASELEVAERERAEAGLRQALAVQKELNALKSSFVSMVSHEFRTPLEVILSSSDILDRYLDRLPPDKRRAQLRAIRKSVHRMNHLVEDVLLLGKLDAGRMACTPVSLKLGLLCRRCVDEVETAAQREGAIQLQFTELEGDACADEGLLGHILNNLLGNALKYSPGRPVRFSVTRRGIDAEFVIRDQGCGIPAADQARLFTAFHRGANVTQTPGTGLGLVIVKHCVELHHGTIRCESGEGVGTSFIVTLPLFDGTRFFRRAPEPTATAAFTESL